MNHFLSLLLLNLSILVTGCNDPDPENNSILRERWKTQIKRLLPSEGNFEVPLIEEDRVYIPNGNKIQCYGLEKGNLIWSYTVSEDLDYNGCNFTTNSTILVINHSLKTVAVNKLTGEEVWVTPDEGVFREIGTLNCMTETSYFRGGFNTIGFIHEYSTETGLLVKQFPFRFANEKANSLVTYGNILLCATITNVDSPMLVDGKTVTGDFGELVAFDIPSGNRLYSIPVLPGPLLASMSNLYANILVSGEDVFTAFRDGTILRVHIPTGKVKWTFNPSNWGYNKPTGLKTVHLSTDGKKLFSTGDMDNWLCVNAETGSLLYFKQFSDYNSVVDAAMYDGKRYIFKPSARVTYEWQIIDINTGEIIETFDQSDDSIISSFISGNKIIARGIKYYYLYEIVK